MSQALRYFVLIAIAAILLSNPASAHREHKEQQQETVDAVAVASTSTKEAAPNILTPIEETKPAGLAARTVDWLGRLHPALVHFPIAFFPAALIASFAARRDQKWEGTARFLLVAGGVLAPLVALLGWLDAGISTVSDDALMSVHRSLGTAIGVAGIGLAAWTVGLKERPLPQSMMWALLGMTSAILVQGWYGGALVHGADHLAF